MERIAIGYDGTPESAAALRWAARTAARRQGSLRVVTAWPARDRDVARAAGTLPDERRRLQRAQAEAIDDAVRGLPARPPVVRELMLGEPEVALAHAAENAALLVLSAGQRVPRTRTATVTAPVTGR
ncbi:universal stress protein [Catenuloplanes atrovinosus]|uniref:Nucleotide-binding universal stress UspA family protein n=1 Tax=Catenuloplanes atrovinosus TaxID=137266 RepID=A0AAE4C6V0_9ACTN|nr:universal stress protein [Catenuloplanes atrovinosus]MDR7273911.1 nucleotide-binding universal stress UspA family protein [Catenuloplanes atrovinosus]